MRNNGIGRFSRPPYRKPAEIHQEYDPKGGGIKSGGFALGVTGRDIKIPARIHPTDRKAKTPAELNELLANARDTNEMTEILEANRELAGQMHRERKLKAEEEAERVAKELEVDPEIRKIDEQLSRITQGGAVIV